MTKAADVGVYRLKSGNWGYRVVLNVNGQKINRRRVTDEFGNKITTKKQAIKERKKAIENAPFELVLEQKNEVSHRTFQEVYEEYCTYGRSDRAYETIRKQDSLWRIHLKERFGKRFVDDISVAEVNDYLSELYYKNGLSYRYVESFLKMFYLVFGQAYSRNYLSLDIYAKLCKNKDTKISMPKIKDEDDTDIVAFNKDELALLDKYFQGKNAETAYLIGRYCGLRINECYGLKWDHVNLKEGTIYIDRQMQFQDGLTKLVPVKTRNGKRTIYLSPKIKEYLTEKFNQREKDEVNLKKVRAQKQRIIDDLDGSKISSTELVNCLPDGTIQTVNSFKYHSKQIKRKLGIEFKYHYLRHTYGTMMAELNTPQHILCAQMGHGNIHVTQLYYLGVTKAGIDILKDKLNQL